MGRKTTPPNVPIAASQHPSSSLELTPAFKLVFLTTAGLTVLSLFVGVGLSLWGRDNQTTERLIETCSTTWKMGFGAIVGMVSGRALS